MAAYRDVWSRFMKSPIDFAIVTPLEEERRAMLGYLPGSQVVPGGSGGPRTYHSATVPIFRDGKKGAYQVIVSDLLAMGRVDAAIVVKDIMHRWVPKHIILTGIAGGWGRAGVNIGDVIIADQFVDPELQKLTEKGREIRWSTYRAHSGLLAASKEVSPNHWQPRSARPDPGQSRRHIGTICTGDKVVADGSLDCYATTWPRLIGVEMEAGGAACAAYQENPAPGFLMVRGVSDLADRAKDNVRTSEWRRYACEVAAAFVAALITSAPIPLSGASDNVTQTDTKPELRCPGCGEPALKVHSRSGNKFVIRCERCSKIGWLLRDGLKIRSFVVPGVITLLGIGVIDQFINDHGHDAIVDSILDLLDYLPDLV